MRLRGAILVLTGLLGALLGCQEIRSIDRSAHEAGSLYTFARTEYVLSIDAIRKHGADAARVETLRVARREAIDRCGREDVEEIDRMYEVDPAWLGD